MFYPNVAVNDATLGFYIKIVSLTLKHFIMKIKKYYDNLNINWKYLLVIVVVVLSPVIYNSIRIFWIVDQGESSLAMTHFSTYLQMTMEIVGAFLLIPLFTYKKEEYKENSLTLFLTISFTMLFFIVASLIVSSIMIKPMVDLNPTESKDLIVKYMIFQGLTWVLVVYEQYLLSDFILERKYSKAIIFCVLSLSLKLVVDMLMLTSFSIIDTNIATISISSFISTLIIVITLLCVHLLKFWNEDKLRKESFSWNQLGTYYYKGVIPALELLIRNLCYSLVTLQALLMLGEADWNAYNMGGYIYWMIIFKITSIFDYYLLSDLSEREDGKMTILFSFAALEASIVLIMGVILTFAYLPSLLNGQSYYSKAILLSIINIPIMIFISTQNVFKLDLITQNKYIYLLGGTLINLVILYTPLIIIIYLTNLSIGFWVNVFIFGISCLIPSVIAIGSSIYLNKKSEEDVDLHGQPTR